MPHLFFPGKKPREKLLLREVWNSCGLLIGSAWSIARNCSLERISQNGTGGLGWIIFAAFSHRYAHRLTRN